MSDDKIFQPRVGDVTREPFLLFGPTGQANDWPDFMAACRSAVAAGIPLVMLPGAYVCASAGTLPAGLSLVVSPGATVDDDASPGQASVARVRSAATLPLVQKAIGETTKIMILGDSNTVGSNAGEVGFVGSWREGLYERLRQWRSDFDFIGHHFDVPELHATGLWYHSATAGYDIGDLADNFESYVSTAGAPDLIIDCIGAANVVAGDSLAAMQAARAALDAAYAEFAPNARVLALALPPFVAGSTVAGNLAAWNAKRALYNAWLEDTHVLTRPWAMRYLDVVSTLSAADYLSDGVHLNRMGQGKMADGLALYVGSRAVLGEPYGYRLPRAFRQRMYQGSRVLATTATDGYTIAAHAGFNAGAGSLAVAFDYYPTDLTDTGNLRVLLQYGAYAASDFWGLWCKGRNLYWYFNTDNAPIFDAASGLAVPTTGLTTSQWHRIVLLAHAASGSIGIYVNGRAVALLGGLSAWSFTQKTVYLGKGPELGAMVGYYSRLHAYKGSAVPQPGTMAALLAVENDYYDEESLCAGASASFNMHTANTDTINGNPSLSAVGGAAATAYPGGATPVRPWEYT